MQIFNPLYNKEQIVRFSNYFQHELIIPHIVNNSHSLYYVFVNNKTNVPYVKFHNNINKFLGVQPAPNNPGVSLPTSQAPAKDTVKKPDIMFNDLS